MSELHPERERILTLSHRSSLLKAALLGKEFRPKLPIEPQSSGDQPVITELERVVDILDLSLSPEWQSVPEVTGAATNSSSNLSQAVHSSSGDLSFVLRGTLAASLCYFTMNAIAWSGISTCMVTCAITALTSVGSSRQKQFLRITGAMAGGLLFGIGSQILIVPGLDTISRFSTLFVIVTFIAAWIATSSPRLSYFGLQMALAFYLIHVQEFSAQTDLATGRDSVVGIALGLLMMWLVFDTLGSRSVAHVMRDTFARNLELLAEQAMPWRDGQPADVGKLRATRDEISCNFAQVNAQADAVLFEIGPLRMQKLALRERLLDLQPRLRSIYFVEVALLQYRITMYPGQLDVAVFEAQQSFDEHVSMVLRRLAKSFILGNTVGDTEGMLPYQQRLESAVKEQKAPSTERTRVLLSLFSLLSELLDTLQADCANF